jgi:hypothetical protein
LSPSARRPQDADDFKEAATVAAAEVSGHDLSLIPVRTLGPLMMQPKLMVNTPGDAYERNADLVAEQVMRTPEPRLQRACACGGGECPKCRAGQVSAGHTHLQTKPLRAGGAGQVSAPPIVHEVLSSPGGPLPATARAFFEPRFGHDFSGVRVHTDSRAAEAARSVRAKAFTVGRHTFFGEGQYSPETERGRTLLAHELTHVVQQSGGDAMLQRAENDTVPNCAALTDSKSDVDTKVNASLKTARASAGKPPSGIAVARGVVGDLASNSIMNPGRSEIEVWASSLPATKAVLPKQSATKYAGVSYKLWSTPFDILNPTMKVNGVCIGSDKLGHFFQQGAQYLTTKSGSGGVAAAEEESERSEGGGFGLATTGVFSNADMEANRQGGKFYADLIASPSMTFAIASYISSKWSEADNSNFYESSVGKQVWANLLTGGWNGISRRVPYPDETLTLSLSATTAGAVTGTLSLGTPPGPFTLPLAGTIKGAITYNTKSVRGENPVTGSKTTETPISGISIDFDWKLGSDSGKGVLTSSGERRLTGTWGNGASTTGRGSLDINHV